MNEDLFKKVPLQYEPCHPIYGTCSRIAMEFVKAEILSADVTMQMRFIDKGGYGYPAWMNRYNLRELVEKVAPETLITPHIENPRTYPVDTRLNQSFQETGQAQIITLELGDGTAALELEDIDKLYQHLVFIYLSTDNTPGSAVVRLKFVAQMLNLSDAIDLKE